MKYTISRIQNPDDLDRCQATTTYGQCINKVVNNSEYCPCHGGNKAQQSEDKKSMNLYRLAKYRARLDEFNDSHNLKSLNEEIGILRMVLEEMLNHCDTPIGLISFAPQISDLAIKIEKLVTSCYKLEKSLSNYLDKTSIIQIAQEIVNIISTKIHDPEIIDVIVSEISTIIDRTENKNAD